MVAAALLLSQPRGVLEGHTLCLAGLAGVVLYVRLWVEWGLVAISSLPMIDWYLNRCRRNLQRDMPKPEWHAPWKLMRVR